MKQTQNIIYLILLVTIVALFTIVFNFFPRSTVSELENRELAKCPDFSWENLKSGKLMADISSWYSDSEPYRDLFMTLSMEVDKAKRLNLSTSEEEDITFLAGDSETTTNDKQDTTNVDSSTTKMDVEDKAKIANAGIVLVGSEPNVRALMAYAGAPSACNSFADVANKYRKEFGPEVNIYCMIIPTAVEFYCPEKAKSRMRSQIATINQAYARLDSGVRAIDVYTPLSQHTNEDIYLRTDHHWSPLGAYYAAQAIAQTAGLPFRDLSHYDRHVVKGYVGSMHRYSKDISVKNSPEDFVYYTPRDIEYNTTYINYRIDKNYNVESEGKPVKGQFFYKFKDGSGGAYCTFMGGDSKITQIRTATKNGRRMVLLKDSYGNPISSYLFFTFEEIHIIDSRYFTRNLKTYVSENNITDIILGNNITFACSYKTINAYRDFLTQQSGKTTKSSNKELIDRNKKAISNNLNPSNDSVK